MTLYYVDTCIWLNLFQKEGDPTKGKPYWKIAEDLISEISASQDSSILISTIVLKELKYKLKEYENALNLFRQESIRAVKTVPEDYDFARIIEEENDYKIGFSDCLHIAISKRNNFILVTRDGDLIGVGKKYIEVEKPEDLNILG